MGHYIDRCIKGRRVNSCIPTLEFSEFLEKELTHQALLLVQCLRASLSEKKSDILQCLLVLPVSVAHKKVMNYFGINE